MWSIERMSLIKLPLWWGYVALDEKIHVKRYKDDRAIRNAQDSGTTLAIADPFEAIDIKEAAEILVEKWREQRLFMKEKVQ